jgi:DNA-binding CsgD family transcriptional regulator
VVLDIWTLILDSVSVGLFILAVVIARWALVGFKQSKQALREAASFVSVIVSALSPRIEGLEAGVNQLRGAMNKERNQFIDARDALNNLQSKYEELHSVIQALLSNDKRLIKELEELRMSQPVVPTPSPALISPISEASRPAITNDPVIDRLTPTERQTLEILSQGALPAPELGRRLNKSREHMARLMKKLYMEGYVDRDSDRSPFRYRLNDKLRSSLGDTVTASPSESP